MADEDRDGQASGYLEYLPAVYQQDARPGAPNFMGRFLLGFEQILTGLGDASAPALEEILDGIVEPEGGKWRRGAFQRYFSPWPYLPEQDRTGPAEDFQAPREFLPWLAGWVALSLRADMDEQRQRDFIARAVPLYRHRGTRQALETFVGIHTRLGVTVNELDTPFQIGVHSTLGMDTILDGGAPYFFRVLIRVPVTDPAAIANYREIASAIIEMEKPAHTYYALDVETPTFQIGFHSTIGVDTLLSPAPISGAPIVP
jgi:P2-related tail formation protein